MTIIYALTCPAGEVRYIGKTVMPAIRLRNHIAEAKQGIKCHRCNWIRSLLRRGLKPLFLEIERCDDAVSADRERWHIADARARGVRLTNGTDGGDGAPGLVFPESAKEILREKATRRFQEHGFTPEHLAAIRAGVAARGRDWITEEWREKKRIAGTFRRHNADSRAKMSAAKLGKKRSVESRRKQSEVMRGRKQSPEHIAKRAEARRRHVVPESVRMKIARAFIGRGKPTRSERMKRRWQDERSRSNLVTGALKRRKLSDLHIAEAARLYEAGHLIATIAEMFSVGEMTVNRALRRYGVKIRNKGTQAFAA
jgi:hypothetical protein